MRIFEALLRTEIGKLKRASTPWLSLILPALLILLQMFRVLQRSPRIPPFPISVAQHWDSVLHGSWTVWAAVVPVLIAMQAAGLAAPEHAGKHWKQLYSLPVPRWSFFATKMLVCGMLAGVSFLVYAIGALGVAFLASSKFDWNLSSAIPWGLIFTVAGRAYLASAAVIAIQMGISMRFSGYAIPVGAAFAGTAATAIMSVDAAGWCWPWAMPMDSLPWTFGHVPAPALLSPLLCILLAVLAGWRLCRAEVV